MYQWMRNTKLFTKFKTYIMYVCMSVCMYVYREGVIDYISKVIVMLFGYLSLCPVEYRDDDDDGNVGW